MHLKRVWRKTNLSRASEEDCSRTWRKQLVGNGNLHLEQISVVDGTYVIYNIHLHGNQKFKIRVQNQQLKHVGLMNILFTNEFEMSEKKKISGKNEPKICWLKWQNSQEKRMLFHWWGIFFFFFFYNSLLKMTLYITVKSLVNNFLF